MKICQFVHYVMPLTMGIIGIGPTSTPPCGSPYFGNAHSFEHYIIPINLGSFFCVCAGCFKMHNTHTTDFEKCNAHLWRHYVFQKHALCFWNAHCHFYFIFPITFNEYPKSTHQISHENFTLCKNPWGWVFFAWSSMLVKLARPLF